MHCAYVFNAISRAKCVQKRCRKKTKKSTLSDVLAHTALGHRDPASYVHTNHSQSQLASERVQKTAPLHFSYAPAHILVVVTSVVSAFLPSLTHTVLCGISSTGVVLHEGALLQFPALPQDSAAQSVPHWLVYGLVCKNICIVNSAQMKVNSKAFVDAKHNSYMAICP